ncbi:MAG: hypothetical protein AAF558_03035 [Verrucomicrobiota bacterium]
MEPLAELFPPALTGLGALIPFLVDKEFLGLRNEVRAYIAALAFFWAWAVFLLIRATHYGHLYEEVYIWSSLILVFVLGVVLLQLSRIETGDFYEPKIHSVSRGIVFLAFISAICAAATFYNGSEEHCVVSVRLLELQEEDPNSPWSRYEMISFDDLRLEIAKSEYSPRFPWTKTDDPHEKRRAITKNTSRRERQQGSANEVLNQEWKFLIRKDLYKEVTSVNVSIGKEIFQAVKETFRPTDRLGSTDMYEVRIPFTKLDR